MKNIPINEPIPVTLNAGEWFWLLGLLSNMLNQGENHTLDKLYGQIMEAVQ